MRKDPQWDDFIGVVGRGMRAWQRLFTWSSYNLARAI